MLCSGGRDARPGAAYASHPLGLSLDETAAFARALVERGFAAVKFGWLPLGPDAARDEAIVRTLREAIGDALRLLIDGGMAWDADTAIGRAQLFHALRPIAGSRSRCRL